MSFFKHISTSYFTSKRTLPTRTLRKPIVIQSISNRFIIDIEKKKLQFYVIHFTICRDVRNDMQIKKPQGYLSKYFCVKSLHSKTHHVGIKFNRISLICVYTLYTRAYFIWRWSFQCLKLCEVTWYGSLFSVCTNRKIEKKNPAKRWTNIHKITLIFKWHEIFMVIAFDLCNLYLKIVGKGMGMENMRYLVK